VRPPITVIAGEHERHMLASDTLAEGKRTHGGGSVAVLGAVYVVGRCLRSNPSDRLERGSMIARVVPGQTRSPRCCRCSPRLTD
jgi:hypothetical protein